MSQSPVYCRPLAVRKFKAGLEEIRALPGLLKAAIAISYHERPELEDVDVLAQLEMLAKQVRDRAVSRNTDALLAHSHALLFDELGYRGNVDDYYSTNNSYLAEVVRRKVGIPISLSLIYAYVAERSGLVVQGINAPGHFLVAVESREADRDSILFVDPYFGGKLLTMPEVFDRIAQSTGRPVTPSTDLLAPASHAMWLGRMLLNLQAIFARAGRERDVYAMQELQGLLDGEGPQ